MAVFRQKNEYVSSRCQHLLFRYLHVVDGVLTPTAVDLTIYDAIAQEPFANCINIASLADIIGRDLPLTVFVPDERAMSMVTCGTLEAGNLIKRHIVRGLFFEDVIANETEIFSVDGDLWDVEVQGESLFVAGALVYQTDNLARNGVFHYVDTVFGEERVTEAPTATMSPTLSPSISLFPTADPTLSPSASLLPTADPTLLDDAPTPGPTVSTMETPVVVNYTVMAPNGTSMELLGPILIEAMDILAPAILGESTVGADQDQSRMLAPLQIKLPTSIDAMVEIGMCL